MNKLIFKIAIAVVILSNLFFAELIFGSFELPDFWIGLAFGSVIAAALIVTSSDWKRIKGTESARK